MSRLSHGGRESPSLQRKLVVGQLCHGSMGGSTRVACRLANALARRGHGVHLFCHDAPPWALNPDVDRHVCRDEARQGSNPGSFYRNWTESDRRAFAFMLKEWLARCSIDIMHFHYAQPFAGILHQVSRDLNDRMPAIVGTLHGTDLTGCLESANVLASLERDLVVATQMTTVSDYMCGLACRLMPTRPALRVIPNFIEDDWPLTARPEGGDSPLREKPIVLHISNFRAVKDVSLLARQFLKIHEKTSAVLWLVGDGPELPALKALLDRSTAQAAVRYLGPCSDPTEYFRRATFLLSTSSQESFGLAVLEAMASGVVVVATAVGGIPELVENDVTGLLFDPLALEATASRVASLLDAPARLDNMRAAASRRVELLRESCVVDQYEDLYYEAADNMRNLRYELI